MKILHTADWHIGKVLHKQDLEIDFLYFSDWLIQTIKIEKINVLLVSGDIFDLANPSNKDIKLYYELLSKLFSLGITTIITGGNHDSPGLLNGPKTLLETINLKIFGCLEDDISKHIIPIYENGKLNSIVLAIPFLRDKDLKKSSPISEKSEQKFSTNQSIGYIYEQVTQKAIDLLGTEVPIIAMGHLHVMGSETSESEREIHIGNLEGLSVDILDKRINYLALGHIHKPQLINGKKNVRYSGSPIYLDFSERNFSKSVVLLEIENNNIAKIKNLEIPLSRSLIKIEGSFEEVKTKVFEFKNKYHLPAFIELSIKEKIFSPELLIKLDQLIETSTEQDQYMILKSKFDFERNELNSSAQLFEGLQIDELNPLEVFTQLINSEGLEYNLQKELIDAYHELLEEIESGN